MRFLRRFVGLLDLAAVQLWTAQQAVCCTQLCSPRGLRNAVRGFGTATFHHHRPRRAMLYVPGSAERKLKKAASELSVDSIVMDCEDGVAINMKEAARSTIANMLNDKVFNVSGEVAVRINPVSSSLAADDLAAVLSARRLPNALVVPKVETPDDVHWVFDQVQQLLSKRPVRQQQGRGSTADGDRVQKSDRQEPMAFIPMCESAMALFNLRDVFQACITWKRHTHQRPPLQVQACILGGDDLAASLGATRTPANTELSHARGMFLITCRAFQVQAIDIVKAVLLNEDFCKVLLNPLTALTAVQIDLSDAGMTQLAEESQEAAMAGWSGKQVIHPKQVPIVQAAFSPSKTDVHDSKRLVAAYQQHQQQGKGAFVFEDRMIDTPTMLQARNVLALAERIERAA